MTVRQRAKRKSSVLLALAATVTLTAGALLAGGASVPSRAATEEPCDIYSAAGTPCVAAFSTTRALYADYDGALYQVERASDDTTTDVYPLTTGGYADAATQDSFCAETYCYITEIFDQSGHGNNLTDAPAGGEASGPDILANAAAAPATAGGNKVYGVDISLGMGYRDDDTTDIATGDEAEGEYAVLDGTHYDNDCCFDFGNAETNNDNDGDGAMEAINFGDETTWGYGSGTGPWIMADMENGLFSGESSGYNAADQTIDDRFTTAMLEGESDQWALLGGNADSGSLTTEYSGVRPSGYNPMKKQGAIILGIGGDNSDSSAGTFYEGVMTSGYPTAAAEAAVQANIVSAGYSTYSTNPFTTGEEVSLQATTPCCTGDYLTGDTSGDDVGIEAVTSSSSSTLKEDATWIVEPGLANSSCVSFESANGSGDYIRHYDFELYLEPNDGTTQFALDATFCPRAGNSGSDYSFMSYNYSFKYIRHYDYVGYVASDGVDSSNAWDASSLWDEDSTWAVASPWS
jgi:hypothetical protein